MSPRGPFLGSLCLATALVMACDRGGGSDAGDPAPTPQPPKPARQALTLEDYAALCTGAEPFDAAPAPAKEGDQPNRVVVFTRWAADDPYRLSQIDAFSPWHPERPNDVSLVVCLSRERKEDVHTCHLETMDGTKVDVAMSNTDNTARVIAAKTGEVLAEQSFELLGTLDCPLSLMASEWYSAEPKQHLQSMLAPLQPEGAPKSNLRPAIKNEACAGVPLLEAAPYDPNSSDEVFLTTSYRQDDSGFPTVSSMPTGLYEAMLHGSSADPQKVQLAVCVTGTPKAKSKDCRFDGGKTLELHDGDYEVVVREALTGKEVERKTFAAAGGECPTSALFRDGESTAVNLGAPEPALGEYIESLTRAEPAD